MPHLPGNARPPVAATEPAARRRARKELVGLVRLFGRLGLIGFGGPAAQIALIRREVVDRHRATAPGGVGLQFP